MASKTTLLSITCYDSDGGLDYAIHGSQTRDYFLWRTTLGHSKEEIFSDLRNKFELMLERAGFFYSDSLQEPSKEK